MAGLFAEGFGDWVTLANGVNGKWNSAVGTPGVDLGGAGSDMPAALKVDSALNYLNKTLPANYPTLILGMAIKVGAPNSGGDTPIWQFIDDDTNKVQITLALTPALRLALYLGDITGTLLAVSSSALAQGARAYVEAKLTFDPSAGAYEV